MATVIFKPSEACNARCVYCDVVHKTTRNFRTMSKEVLETLFVRVNEYLLARPKDDMEIIWHGGEPLLLGPDYFEAAASLQRRHCAGTAHRIRHAIQSNLTALTPELVRALEDLGIRSIGSSYDPFDAVRGLGNSVDHEAYNRRFLEGIALLERSGLGCGIIYVVTKLSLRRPLEIFFHLTNLRVNGAVTFNPVILYGEGLDHLRLTPEEYADFLGAIFPTWWRHRPRYPLVNPFASLVRNLLEGDRRLLCGDSGRCAHTHLNVAPDGRLSQCGRSSDWGLLDYGRVQDRTFVEAMEDPARQVLLDRQRVLAQGECSGCRFWDICHGGCPLDSWYETASYMHRSFWCGAKRRFIEKHFEPTVRGANGRPPAPAPAVTGRPAEPRPTPRAPDGPVWIDPVGGLGDALMLSGVLLHVAERDPDRRFHLVRRTKYGPILAGHPAISRIGHPPRGARLLRTSYWAEPEYGTGARAYQILARMFGLETPVEERLYVPWTPEEDPVLANALPWRERNVAISPASVSPRKQMRLARWQALVELLARDGVFVAQVGTLTDVHVRGAYNLLGLTTVPQLVGLLSRFDAVVTSDNFTMHVAHLRGVPAVVLWGPSAPGVYGYEGQVDLAASPACADRGCIGAGRGHEYGTPCPEREHCMDQIAVEDVHAAIRRLLDAKTKSR